MDFVHLRQRATGGSPSRGSGELDIVPLAQKTTCPGFRALLRLPGTTEGHVWVAPAPVGVGRV